MRSGGEKRPNYEGDLLGKRLGLARVESLVELIVTHVKVV